MNEVARYDPPILATAVDWQTFLAPIAAAVRNPPSQTDFRLRVASLAAAIPDCPAAVLRKPWLIREACTKSPWWPSVADIAELLSPSLVDHRQAGMRALVALPAPADEPRQTPSAEEIAAVKGKLAAFKAASASVGEPHADRPRDKPAHLSPQQRVALYRSRQQNYLADTIARFHGIEE